MLIVCFSVDAVTLWSKWLCSNDQKLQCLGAGVWCSSSNTTWDDTHIYTGEPGSCLKSLEKVHLRSAHSGLSSGLLA